MTSTLDDKLARELASTAQQREGLTPENVVYALKRSGVVADAEDVSAKLRIFGYHPTVNPMKRIMTVTTTSKRTHG